MPNENINYYTELTHNLKHAGFTIGPEENNLLPIELDGKPLCWATESGGVRWQHSHIADDRRKALDSVIAIAKTTHEYMRQMEAAPKLTADGLEGDGRLGFSLCFALLGLFFEIVHGSLQNKKCSVLKNFPNKGEPCVHMVPLYFMFSIILKSNCFCSLFSCAHLSSIFRCSSVSGTNSPSAKNSAKVIPNAVQIASKVDIVGSESSRKMCASVDWGIPDSFLSR